MKKYSVDGVNVREVVFWCWLDEALGVESEGPRFDEWLDDISGPVEIGTSVFNASDVLREMEPITYRAAKSDYIEQRREQCTEELEIDGETEARGQRFQIVEKEEGKEWK